MSWSQNDFARSSGLGFLPFPGKPSISSLPRPESTSGSWLESCPMSPCHYTLAQLPSFSFFSAGSFPQAAPFLSVNCSETSGREVLWGMAGLLFPGGWGELQRWVDWCGAWVRQLCQLLAQPRRRVSGGWEHTESAPRSCLPAGTCSHSASGWRSVHSKGC